MTWRKTVGYLLTHCFLSLPGHSHESLHSDLEEMRELSCGSSLASEDGQDPHEDVSPDSWSQRYNALHRRYLRVLEQKVNSVIVG